MGLISDKQAQPAQASSYYKQAMDMCDQDPTGILIKSGTYKKAGTNYAVTLEKLNKREESI